MTSPRYLLGSLVLASAALTAAQAQTLAPSGYSGLVNTPNADTLMLGDLALGYVNSNPESTRAYPQDGPFGSVLMGFGLLPGLEVVSRLSFDGDSHCNQYLAGCRSTSRDLSANAKYRLPLPELPLKTRAAIGVSDYGGAATNFRQTYGVVTSTLGLLDVSVGRSRAEAGSLGGGLMSGNFGGATFSVAEKVRLHLERDTREVRAGVSYAHKLSHDMDAVLGVSQKVTHNTGQLASQVNLTLVYAMDKPARQSGQALGLGRDGYVVRPEAAPVKALAKEQHKEPDQQAHQAIDVDTLAAAYEHAGFSEISIGREGSLWHVRVEPRGWRKSRIDALAAALDIWLREQKTNPNDVVVTLTYLRTPTLQTRTNSDCLMHDLQGVGLCTRPRAVTLTSEPRAMQNALNSVSWQREGVASQFLRPDFELGPAATYTVGTEIGLYDYSIGLSKGWEVPLAQGLVWQGTHTQLLTESRAFSDPNGYWHQMGMNQKSGRGVNLLTYTRPIAQGVWAEASTGDMSPTVSGQTLNLLWSSPDGRWRLRTMDGRYQGHTDALINPKYRPSLKIATYEVIPGLWSVSATKGTFFNNDEGHHLMSSHYFGQHRVQMYYRRTGQTQGANVARTSMAGFSFATPIGPKESYAVGPVTVRGSDLWQFGLETKVGAKENNITPGLGQFPGIRHGLNDVIDYDRIDPGYLEANLHRLWASMRELSARPR